jgi:hypothetical protein
MELDHLRAAGVELHLVALGSGPVFENIESPGGRRQRCLAASDVMAAGALPTHWTDDLDALFLGPVAGELDASWAAVGAPMVALGWQGLLRELRADADVTRRKPGPDALIPAATLVGASRDDFAPGTRISVLARLLGPSTTLALTEGEHGGRIVRTDGDGLPMQARRYPAIPPDRTVDPTGAGDVFLAALLAATLIGSPRSATRFAAAAASLVVEAPGLAGVPDLEAVRARMTRAPSLASRRPSATSTRASGRPSQA